MSNKGKPFLDRLMTFLNLDSDSSMSMPLFHGIHAIKGRNLL